MFHLTRLKGSPSHGSSEFTLSEDEGLIMINYLIINTLGVILSEDEGLVMISYLIINALGVILIGVEG